MPTRQLLLATQAHQMALSEPEPQLEGEWDFGCEAGTVVVVEEQTDTASEASMIPNTVLVLKGPSFSSSYVWRSKETIRADRLKRIIQCMKHIAPEQSKLHARPTSEPCDIVPMNDLELLEHDIAMAKLKIEQEEKNLVARKAAAQVRSQHPPIRSRFGAGGKVYNDGLSPVLCRSTIWSAEYAILSPNSADWPTAMEFSRCGDRRNVAGNATGCPRYLPLPSSDSLWLTTSWTLEENELALVYTSPAFPFDACSLDLREVSLPLQVQAANDIFDNDVDFENRGRGLLGQELMDEIGQWHKPAIPRWLEEP